jgi:putative Holliday junction resolvase
MYLCKTNKKKMPRILSIDYGQKRTGIAVTDEMKIIASVNNLKALAAIAFLKDYFSKKEAAVIGEPIKMNGPSESASIIERVCNPFCNHFRI